LAKYFDGDHELSADDLLTAAFAVRWRSNAYDMRIVDAYLDRAISVLQAVE